MRIPGRFFPVQNIQIQVSFLVGSELPKRVDVHFLSLDLLPWRICCRNLKRILVTSLSDSAVDCIKPKKDYGRQIKTELHIMIWRKCLRRLFMFTFLVYDWITY